jgi:hypothetical protein
MQEIRIHSCRLTGDWNLAECRALRTLRLGCICPPISSGQRELLLPVQRVLEATVRVASERPGSSELHVWTGNASQGGYVIAAGAVFSKARHQRPGVLLEEGSE